MHCLIYYISIHFDRCGMVYIDSEELKWMPYVKTWMAQKGSRLRQETQEYIMEMFEKMVEDGLVFVKKKCTQAIPQVRHHLLVQSVLQ